jgi:TRAP transporter TAXI family solute receptor
MSKRPSNLLKIILAKKSTGSQYFEILSRKFVLTISACMGLLLLLVGTLVLNRLHAHKYMIAAGAVNGESYLLSLAVADLVTKYQPHIKIQVIPSDGSKQNIQLLEDNKAQLATAQADIPVLPSGRIVTFLYPDVFQLIVKGNDIKKVADLRFHKIARPPKEGGQIESFEVLVEHYGLKSNDIIYIDAADGKPAATDEEQAIKQSFAQNQIHAVFHVRPIGNQSILELIKSGGHLLPIDQANAMRIKQPNYKTAVIPKGTYQGNPPTPDRDLPTVSVERILLARKDLPTEDLRQITSTLYEHRQELDEKMEELAIKDRRLAQSIPLAAYIHPPNISESVSRVPVHPGAQAYYEREKPSFFKANADVLALLFSIAVLVGSWVWEFKSRLDKKQKNQVDGYSERVIQQLNEVMIYVTDSNAPPQNLRQHLLAARKNLLDIFKESVTALNNDLISPESFQSFRVVWQIAMAAVEHEDTLVQKSL